MRENTKKTASEVYQISIIKTIMIFSMAILMLNFASAFDFDNVIKYSEDLKTVEIVNAFDIPLLNTKIATIKLANPLTNNYIEAGKDKVVFQMEIESFNDNYIDAIKTTKILNLNAKGREVSKDFKWVYAVYGDVKVNDYGTSCKEVYNSKNATTDEVCTRGIIGSHTENQIVEWREFTGKDIVKGTMTLGLMTDVEDGDYYDGIPNLFGKEITSWVSWSGITKDTSANNWGQSDPASQPYFGSYFQVKSEANTQIVSWTLNSGSANALQCGLTISKNEVYMGSLSGTNCSFASPPTLANGTKFYAWSSRNNASEGWTYGADYSASLPDAQTNVKWLSATYSGEGWNCVNNTAQLYEVQYVYSRTQLPDNVPAITLQTPANNSVFRTSNVSFFLNASDDLGIENLSLIIDGVINYTNTSVDLISSIDLQLNFSDGTYVWNGNATDTGNQRTTGVARTFTINTKPNIDFVTPTPANNTNRTITSIPINVSLTETYFKNLTIYLYKNGVFDLSVGFDDSVRYWNFTGLTDGNYTYNASVWTTTNQHNETETRVLTIDTSAPNVLIGVPVNGSTFINISESTYELYSNATITDAGLSSCWWNVDGGAKTIITCGNSVKTNLTGGNHNFTWYANDSIGNTKSNTSYFGINLINITQSNYPSSSSETSASKFLLNLSFETGTTFVSTYLVYNGTSYVVSDITNYGTESEFKKTIDLPLNTNPYKNESRNFYWNFIISYGSSYNRNSSTYAQNVPSLNIINCNNTYNITTSSLNFTTYNEMTPKPLINSTFSTFWTFWTGSGSVTKNYSWADTSLGNSSFKFCISPNESTIHTDLNSQITSTGYFPRTYYLSNATITNTTQEVSLYLINDTLGVKFFHTLRQGVARVGNADVIISKFDVGLGAWVVVGIRQSDDQGEFIEYLELDKDYTYSITKDGDFLGNIEKTATCSATPCLVNLDITSSLNLWDGYYDAFAQGVVYNLSYDISTKNVTYTFVDTSGLANYFRLQVNKVSANETGEMYCNKTLYATLGELKCDLTGETGQFVAKGYVSRSPEKPVGILYGILNAIAEFIGKNDGLFFTLLFVLVVGLIGAFNPVVGVVLAGLAFVFAGIMGFVMISTTAIFLVVFLIILLVIKMGRQNV